MSNVKTPAYPAHGRDRGLQAGKCQMNVKLQKAEGVYRLNFEI
jgi:hypothetical protein